jgi:hypothetical protein
MWFRQWGPVTWKGEPTERLVAEGKFGIYFDGEFLKYMGTLHDNNNLEILLDSGKARHNILK